MNFLTLFLSFILFYFFACFEKKLHQSVPVGWAASTSTQLQRDAAGHQSSKGGTCCVQKVICMLMVDQQRLTTLGYDQQRQSLTACSAWPTVVHKKWGRNPHSCETWHFSNITSKTPIGKSTCQSNLFPHEIFLKVWQSGYFLLHKPTSPIHLRLQTHVKYGGSLWLKS